MTVITMPDGQAVDFGNMPPDQIRALIQRKFPDAVKASPGATMPGGASPAGAAAPSSEATSPEYGSVFDPIMQGVTFGTFDELVGGIGGIASLATGGEFGKGYDQAAGIARENLDAYRGRHPVVSAVGEVGGALATLPVSGPLNIVRGPAAVSRMAPIGAKVGNAFARGGASAVNAAATGAAYGAAYGAGSADGGLSDRLKGAADSAMVGGALGVGGNAALGAGKWVAQAAFGRPLQALRSATRSGAEADRQVTAAIRDDAAMRGESPQQAVSAIGAAQRQGVPMTALDVGESTRDLGRAAANISPQGRDMLTQSVNRRLETQSDRVIETITRFAPGVNAPQTRQMLEDAARNANRQAYSRAYMDGSRGIWNQQIEGLTVSPDIQAAIRDATRIGANEAARRGQRPPRNPFRTNADGTINPIPDVQPTLEFWDHVKRSLDGQIGIQQRAGNREYASQLTGLKNQLVGILDGSVPSYRAARQGAAAFFGADNALDAGAAFVRRTGDNEGAREAIARMTPAERRLFGEGYATAMIEDVRNIPDRYTVINKIFQSPAARERFEIALGPQATNAMEANLRLESVLDLGRLAVTGNSITARQQLAAQAMIGGTAGAIINGDPLDPRNLIYMALSVGIGRGAQNLMSRADQQMARRVAEMLASDDPQVVQDALRRVSQSPRLMQGLRTGHAYISRALQPLVSGGSASGIPAMVDSGTGGQPAQAGN